MRVIDIMSAPVHAIGAKEPATAAWEAMRLHRTRHLGTNQCVRIFPRPRARRSSSRLRDAGCFSALPC